MAGETVVVLPKEDLWSEYDGSRILLPIAEAVSLPVDLVSTSDHWRLPNVVC